MITYCSIVLTITFLDDFFLTDRAHFEIKGANISRFQSCLQITFCNKKKQKLKPDEE